MNSKKDLPMHPEGDGKIIGMLVKQIRMPKHDNQLTQHIIYRQYSSQQDICVAVKHTLGTTSQE